jgi:2-polyprenyl-3-methyl-5-hydroxy-6-metoxy-1,4-benzoquinol methylase
MIKSKPWDWSKNESDYWLIPTMEASYLIENWAQKGFKRFLDLGCGLGRHSIYFALNNFEVHSVDLSQLAVEHLRQWAEKENLTVDSQVCDMLNLPFKDNCFDCVMAYNVIYHTDTEGFLKTLSEITRVMKPGGELFLTLISKNTWSFQNGKEYKRLDENTLLRDEHDTERDVPHFYVDIEDIKKYFKEYEFVQSPVEYTEYNMEDSRFYSKHFTLLVKKKLYENQ